MAASLSVAAPRSLAVPASLTGEAFPAADVRHVNLAITMPIPAHSAASAISWVPISRLLRGLTLAVGAARPAPLRCCATALEAAAPAAGRAAGLGVTAAIVGRRDPMLPRELDLTELDLTGRPGIKGSDPDGKSGSDPDGKSGSDPA